MTDEARRVFAEQVLDELARLALTAESESVRANAAQAYLDRIGGRPPMPNDRRLRKSLSSSSAAMTHEFYNEETYGKSLCTVWSE